MALWAIRQEMDVSDGLRMEPLARAAQIDLQPGRIWLNGEDVTEAIRTQEVSDGASRISAVSGVRRAMVSLQREIGRKSSVVMEGRDIGTVVFPDAAVKVYLDAQVSERVRRRLADLRAKGDPIGEAELTAQMRERDERDSTRGDSPLAQAPDAVYLDSTGQSIDQVVEAILKIVRERVSNGKDYR